LYWPPLAFRECLFQKREVEKRIHRRDVDRGKLFAQQGMIEPAFEVMQASAQETFAVQTAPELDVPSRNI
jgi:hypothetical protein